MEKTKYKITEKFTKEVINEILNVEQSNGLTAENLLEKAQDQNSELHDLFEWDNSTAGEKWRVYQARQIINEVKIVVKDKEIYAFENVNVKISKSDKKETSRQYKPILEVLSKTEYRKQIIHSALENIKYWKEKYQDYSELKPIFNSIDKVNNSWRKKKQ